MSRGRPAGEVQTVLSDRAGEGETCRKWNTTSSSSPQMCPARSSLARRPEALSASTHVKATCGKVHSFKKRRKKTTINIRNWVSGKKPGSQGQKVVPKEAGREPTLSKLTLTEEAFEDDP